MSKKNRTHVAHPPAAKPLVPEVPGEPVTQELTSESAAEFGAELSDDDDELIPFAEGDLPSISDAPDDVAAVIVDIAGRVAYMLEGDEKKVPPRDVAIEAISKAIPVMILAARQNAPEANLFQSEITENFEKDPASFCGDVSRMIRAASPKKVTRTQSVELARQLVSYLQSMPLEQTEVLYSAFPAEPAVEE